MQNILTKIAGLRTTHPIVFGFLDIVFFGGALMLGLAYALSSQRTATFHGSLIWLTPIGGALGCLRYLITGVCLPFRKVQIVGNHSPSFHSTEWMNDFATLAVIAPGAFYLSGPVAIVIRIFIGITCLVHVLTLLNWILKIYVKRSSAC